MTVESKCVIAIAALSDWLKKTRASISTNENQNQNQSHHVRVIFPALRAVLVFRQSFENRSINFVFNMLA